MTSTSGPSNADQDNHSTDEQPSEPELGDDVAQQSATGSSGPDADAHLGQEAPASEGKPPFGQ